MVFLLFSSIKVAPVFVKVSSFTFKVTLLSSILISDSTVISLSISFVHPVNNKMLVKLINNATTIFLIFSPFHILLT